MARSRPFRDGRAFNVKISAPAEQARDGRLCGPVRSDVLRHLSPEWAVNGTRILTPVRHPNMTPHSMALARGQPGEHGCHPWRAGCGGPAPTDAGAKPPVVIQPSRSLPLADRVLLVATCYRTNLTMRSWRRCSGSAPPRCTGSSTGSARSWRWCPRGASTARTRADRGRHPGPDPRSHRGGGVEELPVLGEHAGHDRRRDPLVVAVANRSPATATTLAYSASKINRAAAGAHLRNLTG